MLEWIKVAYKQLLLERIEFVAERAQTAHLNLKNHWIRKIPDHYFIPLVQGDGDYYGEIEMSNEISAVLLSDRVAPFWNPCFEEVGEHQLWGLYIEKRYADILDISSLENMRYRPSQICLCSIVDLGAVGRFDSDYSQKALQYMKEIGYEQSSTIEALLLGRGVEGEKDIRMMELHIPVREKTL